MQQFDLGHLEILEVLLKEQSVSEAAKKLHISPSALSRTLSKMREATGDDLLTPAGRDLVLTRRGSELRDQIKILNDQARLLLGPKRDANPSEIRRVFRIRASDYSTCIIGTKLVSEVNRLAPHATVSFVSQGKAEMESFRQGTIDFDLGVLGNAHTELMSTDLMEDSFVCAFSNRLKLKTGKMSLSEFCARPHIIASLKGKTSVIIDDLLAKAGKKRRILATVSSFQEALLMASQSEALVVVPLQLVEALGKPLGLRSSPLPVATPRLSISLTWHSRNRDDREHQWLRNLICNLVKQNPSRAT